ncbi:hypothetical protein AAH991_38145 [Microbispora sp. ZYX-F-249]|uniref:Uncharacterized protein n=1 Tax=Microbispora maris TaxID=3144104 RepID=A0ABV0B0G0_9ACTN
MPRPLVYDPDLVASVRDDLSYLAESWKQPITEASVRRESGVLRRLLLDEHSTLQQCRKMLGLKGEAHIQAFDLKEELGSSYNNVRVAFAGGAQVGDAVLALNIASFAPLPPASFKIQRYPLSGYMQAPAIVIMGKPVTRRLLVRYVANKLGGVHYDRRRGNTPEDILFTVLDKNRGDLIVHGIDIVYYEVLAIGQHLLRSPGVAQLLPDPDMLKDVPGLEEIRAAFHSGTS